MGVHVSDNRAFNAKIDVKENKMVMMMMGEEEQEEEKR